MTLKRDKLLQMTTENENILSTLKQTANENGNELQVKYLEDQMRELNLLNEKLT